MLLTLEVKRVTMLANWPVFAICTDIDPFKDAVPLFLSFALHVQRPFSALKSNTE